VPCLWHTCVAAVRQWSHFGIPHRLVYEVDDSRGRLVGIDLRTDVTLVAWKCDQGLRLLLHHESKTFDFSVTVVDEGFEIDLASLGVDTAVKNVFHYVVATEEYPSLVVCECNSFVIDLDVDGRCFGLYIL